MIDKWTILLTGPSNGLVGSLGESFKDSPCHYERVDVVRADRYRRLREALGALVEVFPVTASEEEHDTLDDARAILAELDKDPES